MSGAQKIRRDRDGDRDISEKREMCIRMLPDQVF